MTDLDKLRKQMKARKSASEAKIKNENGSEGFKPSDPMHSPTDSSSMNDAPDPLLPLLNPETEDVTVVVLTDKYIYLCFGGTDRKIRIPCDRIGLNANMAQISEAVESLTLPILTPAESPHPVYSYLIGGQPFLTNAKFGLILFSSHPKSLIKAMELRDSISTPARLLHIGQLSALGKYGLRCVRFDDEEQVAYCYGNRLLTIEMGDGVFEIKEDFNNSRYVGIDLKDLVKGALYQFGVLIGDVKNLLLLPTMGQDLKFILNDGVRDIYEEEVVDKNVTIPTRIDLNLSIPDRYRLKLCVNEEVVAEKLCSATNIRSIVIDANYTVILTLQQGNRISTVSLHSLFFSEKG